MLVLAIGPVQGFIASARRGRDLWFGSWLLSELARAAGTAAREHLVMPTSEIVADERSAVSNKLLLHLSTGDPATIAAAMEAAARGQLRKIRERVFEGLSHDLVHVERAVAQVDELLEVAWASADIRAGQDYRAARRLAEALLAARKGSKPFTPPMWADDVPKSSLDGERESVLRRGSPENARMLHSLGVGPSEHLCGVGLLKRLGNRADDTGGRVWSTSHVASASLRNQLAAPGLRQACRAAFVTYEGRLRELGAELSRTPEDDPVLGRCDGHILYESRIRDLFSKGATEVAQARHALREMLVAWQKAASQQETDLLPLTPYYAVLVADGDHMGKAIDAVGDPEAHRSVTGALERFAMAAREVVSAHHGHCVYSGGDDVLALLPTAEAMACASALDEAFVAVGEALGSGPRPTLSVGIGVAHHIAPLRDALDGARAAERYAKDVVKRNGWAVRVDKRGGVPVVAGEKWDRSEWLVRSIDVMRRLDLTRSLPYEVRRIASELPGAELRDLRRAELRRVLAQKHLAPEMFDPQLGDDVDLGALADRLLVARALSGMEGDHESR